MIPTDSPFNTNVFFSGGAGMFLQYHDIIKPTRLFSIIKMILMDKSFGLPLNIIKNMSILSLIEWYVKRRYKNPLQALDYGHIIDQREIDDLLLNLLRSDKSIYKISPSLNIRLMMNVYRRQHMQFPIYIYSEEEEPFILDDCKELFSGISIKYLYGDLKQAIEKCDQNFTYILSDIELIKPLSEILIGSCSHILLAREYRYNYIDHCKTFKYDLAEIAKTHPYVRIGTTIAMDMNHMAMSIKKVISP